MRNNANAAWRPYDRLRDRQEAQCWSRLLAVLDTTESRGSFLFKPFLSWFAPYFNAYSFPMARANEYQADATSARLPRRRLLPKP